MTAPEFPGIPEGAVKLHQIGEAYADVAMVEETLPRMVLSPWLVPTVQLPQKPPPARAGYLDGSIGGSVAAVALNFSELGLFNEESVSRLIVKVHALTLSNRTGTETNIHIMRLDGAATGFTFLAWVPCYADAGIPSGVSLGRIDRNDQTTQTGTLVTILAVPPNTTYTVPFQAIINNGAFLISNNIVNSEVSGSFWFSTYPIIQSQRS